MDQLIARPPASRRRAAAAGGAAADAGAGPAALRPSEARRLPFDGRATLMRLALVLLSAALTAWFAVEMHRVLRWASWC
jgi:hypothetical protein